MRVVWLPLAAVTCEPLLSGRAPQGDDTGSRDQDALVVTPADLDFGTISVIDDVYVARTFTITNAGTSTIAVHGHDEVAYLSDDDSDVFEVAADPVFELGPGRSQDIQVVFRPSTESAWDAEIRVNYGVEVLTLAGAATAPVAGIALEDGDAWATPYGCSSSRQVVVANDGSETLLVEDAWFADDGPFAVTTEVGDLAVEPGDETRLDLRFEPTWTAASSGPVASRLYVQTNDPAVPIDVLDVSALAYGGSRITETFTYAPGLDADVLFAVDTDGVMAAHLGKGRSAMDDLVDALDEGNVDLHAAVVTGATGCPPSGWTSSDDARALRISTLQDGLDGPQGAWSDRLLGLADEALAQDVDGGCLDGFLRSGAQLHLVVVAGGPDESGQTVTSQLAALAERAPLAAEVVVSAVIATESAGCDGADYGSGYADAALATGGEIRDLCAADWEAAFGALANVSVLAAEGGSIHGLSAVPLVESVVVKVEGVTWTAWTYDEDANALVFDASGAPDAGSTVDVSYLEAVSCE